MDGSGDAPTVQAGIDSAAATGGDFHLAQGSPAITHVAGPLGFYPIPGCGPVPVRPTTWGRLKTRYQ